MRWWLVVAVMAGSARAEEWADEPATVSPQAPEPAPAVGPFVGPVVGVQLGVAPFANDGPVVGARLGARVRLGPHLALSVLGSWELGHLVFPFTPPIEMHVVCGLARLELFTVSAFARVLVPELSVGALWGVGAVVSPLGDNGTIELAGQAGLHFGLTRLRPSGWWFPVYLELILAFAGTNSAARLVAGVGL